MSFKYVCFISYAHSPGERATGKTTMMQDFVDELKRALVDEFEPLFEEDQVYMDREQLAGGAHFNEALAHALCQSFCMVVVYVPRYENRTFCLQEFRGMELLEQQRMRLTGQARPGDYGMIIPVVLRGVDDLPNAITERIHYLDFSQYTTATPNIRNNSQYVDQIKRVAKEIRKLHTLFNDLDPCQGCDQFTLPDADRIQPLRATGKPAASAFPGRPGTV